MFKEHKPNPRACVTIPERAGPFVKLLFAEMRRLGMRIDDVVEKSGVQRAAIKAWRVRNSPGLDSISATLQSVGWTLVPIPNAKILPRDVVDELQPIADRLGLTMPEAIRALVAIASGVPNRFESPADPGRPA